MFQISINNTKIVFSKFFAQADAEAVRPHLGEQVACLDTPPTAAFANLVQTLVGAGVKVVVRDHHDAPNARTPREQDIQVAAARVRSIASTESIISDRATHPACSSLVALGEFAGWTILADPDPDGLLAALKAVGVVYPDLERDAAVLDGPRSEQNEANLSPLAMLLVKGMSTLPPYNPERPEASEAAKGTLFSKFASAVQGDEEARAGLEKGVAEYEKAVAEAVALAEQSIEIFPGVLFVDVGKKRYHLGTLANLLEAKGAKVTVVRKNEGPIAAKQPDGVQVSLAVAKPFQSEINLQTLLPAGFVSSPEAGILSNTTFLLHLSEQHWLQTVAPNLKNALLARDALGQGRATSNSRRIIFPQAMPLPFVVG